MEGITDDVLEELCKETSPPSNSNWAAEKFGFGKIIRNYGFYPKFLPLCIMTDHGPNQADAPLPLELNSSFPVQFYHSLRMVREWKKLSQKPCYVLYSPFVYYRKKNKITQSKNARGTLVFPAHSTPNIDDESKIDRYIEELLKLPQEFHPISACIFHIDVHKGLHKKFRKYNIPLYTAGCAYDERFAERFYSILKNFKYSTSNLAMSCLFYSVEMGIPHFLYGPPPMFNNKGNTSIDIGHFDPYEWKQMKKLQTLFYGLNTKINSTQKDLVEQELGLKFGVSRLKLSFCLYYSYIHYFGLHHLKALLR